jgi:hypothetical protein
MASVEYSCECGKKFHITQLYYCHTCKKLTCPFCVNEEIVSYYCPQCLETATASETISLGSRCKKCYECPQCTAPLVYMLSKKDEKIVADDVTYLQCGFCQWNSLSLEIKADSASTLIATSLKKERESPQQIHVNRVIETVKTQQHREQYYPSKHSELFKRLNALTSLLSSTSPKRGGTITTHSPNFSLAQLEHSLELKEKKLKKRMGNTTTYKGFDFNTENTLLTFYEHLTTETFSSVSSLSQRLSHPNAPSVHLRSTLVPRRVLLLTRRMKHCRRCGRLLIKPELSPQLTQFKRQHVALLYVPCITVKRHSPLIPFKENVIILTFTNPQHCLMHLSITPLSLSSSTAKITNIAEKTFIGTSDWDDEDLQNMLPKTAELSSTKTLSEISMLTAEHDWEKTSSKYNTDDNELKEYLQLKTTDNSNFIHERKGNTVSLKTIVVPKKAFGYVNCTLSIGVKYKGATEEQTFQLIAHLKLGPVATKINNK